MKKEFLLPFLLSLSFLLSGCVASQDEIQTLKIKVVNLETILNTQNQKYQDFEKRLNEIDKKVISLENKISKELMVDIKTQVFSELEEIKNEQAILSSQLEELKFSKEAQEKELATQLGNLSTQIQALELKIKDIEKNFELTPKPVSNETVSSSNQTISSNELVRASVVSPPVQPEKPEEKPLTESDLYNKAYSYYQKGDFKNARKFFEEYIEKFPKGKWIGQAYFWIGESYSKEKNYEEAILSYQKLIELPGWHPLKPTAMLKQAHAFNALGDKEAYKILLKKLITQYPKSKEAEEAKKLLK